jgi:hypothetical protein
MSETSFNFPTEDVNLPSEGLLYSKDSLLSKGKVTMKYGTTREEDILTNQNYIKQGIVLDKLLQSMIVDKINLDELLIGDKNALLIAARILLWGAEYKFNLTNPDNEKELIPHSINLTEVKDKNIDKSLITAGQNEFNFKLPHTSTNLTFKLLTVKDEKNIEAEIKGLKKVNVNSSTEMSTRLKYLITSVEGDRTPQKIREFVDRMIARDSRALREYIKKVQPDTNLTFEYDFGNGNVEVPIPMTIDFFWPSAE